MKRWIKGVNIRRSLSLLVCLIIAISVAFGQQSRKELEDRRKKLLREIEQTSRLLSETKQSKEAAISRYLALEKQIGHRQLLIETLQSEVQYLTENMERTADVVVALSDDVDRLREEYAQIARHAYRQQLTRSNWMFVFSAKSFNDAFRRWQYLRQYDRYRQKQAQLILETQQSLMEKIRSLDERKHEKELLLDSTRRQSELLGLELTSKNRLLEELKGSETRLVRELNAKRSAAEKLNAAIEKIIKEEMKRIQREERPATPGGAAEKPRATPEVAALSKDFQKNRGKLPWPVAKGVVTGRFGRQSHPTIPNIEIVNNGVDISTDHNATVKAIFEGSVVGTQFVPGFDYMVILQHGQYYTVYSNLEEVHVKKGDKVKLDQTLGIVSTNRKTNTSEVHFEIWKEKERLNPQQWLNKM